MSASRDDILDTIAGILGERFGVAHDRVTPEASFQAHLGLDSLEVVDFIFFLHEQFGYRASLEEYRHLERVDDLVRFVAERRST